MLHKNTYGMSIQQTVLVAKKMVLDIETLVLLCHRKVSFWIALLHEAFGSRDEFCNLDREWVVPACKQRSVNHFAALGNLQ